MQAKGRDAGFMIRSNISDRLMRQSRFGLRPSQLCRIKQKRTFH